MGAKFFYRDIDLVYFVNNKLISSSATVRSKAPHTLTPLGYCGSPLGSTKSKICNVYSIQIPDLSGVTEGKSETYAHTLRIPRRGNPHAVLNLDLSGVKDLINQKNRVLLSFSGGQDSICFVFILNQLYCQLELDITFFWCHHLWQIDSFYLMQQIAKLSFLFQFNSCFPIPLSYISSELLARKWRQSCSYRVCLFYNYSKICLAHTFNDKVENIFLNFIRGTGLIGLTPLRWIQLAKRLSKSNIILNNFVSTAYPFVNTIRQHSEAYPIQISDLSGVKDFVDTAKFTHFVPYKSSICTCKSRRIPLWGTAVPHTNLRFVRGTATCKSRRITNLRFSGPQRGTAGKRVGGTATCKGLRTSLTQFVNTIRGHNYFVIPLVFLCNSSFVDTSSEASALTSTNLRFVPFVRKFVMGERGNAPTPERDTNQRFVMLTPYKSPICQELQRGSANSSLNKYVLEEKMELLTQLLFNPEGVSCINSSCVIIDSKRNSKRIMSTKWNPFAIAFPLQGVPSVNTRADTYPTRGKLFLRGDPPTRIPFGIHLRCNPLWGTAVPHTNLLTSSCTSTALKGKPEGYASARRFVLSGPHTNRRFVRGKRVGGTATCKSPGLATCKGYRSTPKGVTSNMYPPHAALNLDLYGYALDEVSYNKPFNKAWGKQLLDGCSIVRPLLSINRIELNKICYFWELPIYPDKSNQKVKFLRNRVRSQLLPTIKFFFNLNIENIFLQLAKIIETEDYYLTQIVNEFTKNTDVYHTKLDIYSKRKKN